VQVDLSKVLNSRGVATLVDGKVVTLQINGRVITLEAATALDSKSVHSVSNDGKFAANDEEPKRMDTSAPVWLQIRIRRGMVGQ